MAAIEVKIPDIGDFKDVPVIEVLVHPGEAVKKDDSLITLESDKATMEVPAPSSGTVSEMRVKVGDKVSEGTLIALLEGAAPEAAGRQPVAAAQASKAAPWSPAPRAAPVPSPAPRAAPVLSPAPAAEPAAAPPDRSEGQVPAHASPGVRRFARELGVDVSRVQGSGPKARILKQDIQGYVKQAIAGGVPAGGAGLGELGLPPWPKVDFAKFGPVELQPRSRIQKISGPVLARNWVMIPHVTQFDEADITELEEFRKRVNEENAKSGVKVTPLAFLVKAVVAALKRFPAFNSSLDGDNLVLKHYWHIGFAADTPNGLVVPVIRNADQKGVVDIARESAELAAKAREGKLGPAEMQGGTFSISSLGGIGGTAFTPIINAPEVAILGASKAAMKPVWNGKEFAPRLLMPLSLSYDHRVIDGALAARFTTYLAQVIADLRRVLL